jgi:hypothetical protein
VASEFTRVFSEYPRYLSLFLMLTCKIHVCAHAQTWHSV